MLGNIEEWLVYYVFTRGAGVYILWVSLVMLVVLCMFVFILKKAYSFITKGVVEEDAKEKAMFIIYTVSTAVVVVVSIILYSMVFKVDDVAFLVEGKESNYAITEDAVFVEDASFDKDNLDEGKLAEYRGSYEDDSFGTVFFRGYDYYHRSSVPYIKVEGKYYVYNEGKIKGIGKGLGDSVVLDNEEIVYYLKQKVTVDDLRYIEEHSSVKGAIKERVLQEEFGEDK